MTLDPLAGHVVVLAGPRGDTSVEARGLAVTTGMSLLACGMLLTSIYFYSEEVLLALAIIYVASGPVSRLVPVARAVRRSLPGRVEPAEHAHGNIKT